MSKLQLKLDAKSARMVVIALALVVVFAAVWYVYVLYFQPITVIDYKGYTIGFRADLRQAAKVPAYPGEGEIYRDTMHQLVKNVTIVFMDAGPSENAYIKVEALELYNKIRTAYALTFGTVDPETGNMVPNTMPTFDVQNVSSYENLPGKIQNPIVAIIPPTYANETCVRNDGHVTFISGLTTKELDLATTKFIMIELGISEADLSA